MAKEKTNIFSIDFLQVHTMYNFSGALKHMEISLHECVHSLYAEDPQACIRQSSCHGGGAASPPCMFAHSMCTIIWKEMNENKKH